MQNTLEKILKANRLYNFISHLNQMIIRTPDESTLFQSVCDIAVNEGQFKMAWIGLVDEHGHNVLPVNFAGHENGYLAEIKKIKLDNSPEGYGPTGRAIREGKYIISYDIATDLRMEPWRAAALARGYHSSIALPVKKFDKIIGAFSVYADEKEFFDKEEIELLQTATDDISFALENISRKEMQQRAQDELRNSIARFEMITHATNDALWEWNLDTGELWANETHQQLYGLTLADPVPAVDTWIAHIHPDDRTVMIEKQSRSLQADKNFFYSEYRFRGTDGKYINIYDRCYIVRDTNGQPLRMVGSMMNITDQKNAEVLINKEKELSDSIINSLPGIFYLYDNKGKFIRWNEDFAKVSGYSNEEIAGMHPLDFFAEDEKGLLAERITAVFKTGFAEVEAHFFTKSGEKIPYYFNGRAIQFGDASCLLGVGVDITEIKKADKEIKKVNRELHELSAHLQSVREEERIQIARDIHDELGQQLTGLKMDIDWIDKKTPDSDTLLKPRIMDMSSLVEEAIKTVRRISADLRPSMLDDFGLEASLEWQSREVARRYDMEIHFVSTMTETELSEDISTGLFRIYQEALTNAVKHANAKRIDSKLQVQDGYVCLEIRDNGIGIDKKTGSAKKTFGLLGIRERVFLLHGKYDLASEPGKGTCLSVAVPINYIEN